MEFHRVLLLLIPTLYMVVPLLIDSWQRLDPPWQMPYAVWLITIILAFVIEKGRHDA